VLLALRVGPPAAGVNGCSTDTGDLPIPNWLPMSYSSDVGASRTEEQEDPRLARRQARMDAILSVAWDIAEEFGLAAVSLSEVARRVGLRQPSLYVYVDSKLGLLDAMFAQAAHEHLEYMRSVHYSDQPRAAVIQMGHAMLHFARERPAKAQLLFDRTIPGFEPSAESFALAIDFMDWGRGMLAAAGVTEPGDVDIATVLVAGVIGVQEANEPGGDRWAKHLEVLYSMFFNYLDDKSANLEGSTLANDQGVEAARSGG